ncbi:MAG: ribosome maturation factor RimP [Candidatus Omnitrophica bacterium]|nr:ribosome maturation factor RimP [Candidatus Omnitrophota bacterium]MDD5592390.1 ribosome maturation factor RimP [Candidatus Omnitrophota bacterium]
MDRQEISAELSSIFGDYLKNQGLDLVELMCRYEGRDLVLRILTDRPEGGITLAECAALNKQISAILDEKDILQARYLLEVCSPGLDRPLKTKKDFLRCINKKARFFLNEVVGDKIEWEGIINKVSDEIVYIDIGDRIIEVPLVKINKAKQVIV